MLRMLQLSCGRSPRRNFPLSLSAQLRPAATAVLLASLVALSTATSASAQEPQHTVRPGETLSDIAARNRTTVRALAEANGLHNVNRIVIGQVLVIPATAAASAATVVHVVAPGETLSGIASRYGTTARALAQANGISNPNVVRIGARLTVPAGSGAGGGGGATTVVHTVAAGEFLAGIAARYSTSVGAIVSANRLSNPNVIRIGQQLTITPGTGGGGATGAGGTSAYAATGASDGRTGVAGIHTVASGDTLHGIARRYGVTAEALAAANGIPRPWNLYAGARLFLSAPNRLPGDLPRCPVPGATFVNDWGFPRSGGRAHEGTDLFAPRGTPVLAPATVTMTGRP